jgi:Fe-S-cluster-containing hydrogenase component 2
VKEPQTCPQTQKTTKNTRKKKTSLGTGSRKKQKEEPKTRAFQSSPEAGTPILKEKTDSHIRNHNKLSLYVKEPTCIHNLEGVTQMVAVDVTECVGCKRCLPYCPADAISMKEEKAYVNQDECVECYTCLRAEACLIGAIHQTELAWPRTLRHVFSSVTTVHRETRVPGRGTEEMKTNDVTDRFADGEVGFSVDIGRPGVGVRLNDVEKVAMAVAKCGVEFEPMNPVTILMTDKSAGRLLDEIKGEKIHSCVLEFKSKSLDDTQGILSALRAVAKDVDTVFSVGVCSKLTDEGESPVLPHLRKASIDPRPNGKLNIGLGRPLREGGT